VDAGDLDEIVSTHRQRVAEVLPNAEVHLTGSASVADLDAKDVDLVGLVEDVPAAAAELRRLYPPLYEEHWTADWAVFREPGPPQVDVVLTRRGTDWDARHRLAWELLQRDPQLRAEYAALKAVPMEYDERKWEFFERIVAQLRSDSR
jgi:GrpB-like predicted nucleotidyltransferase (UPF0157 family)